MRGSERDELWRGQLSENRSIPEAEEGTHGGVWVFELGMFGSGIGERTFDW